MTPTPGETLNEAGARRLVRWLRDHARGYGIDPSATGALGWGDGGRTAVLLLAGEEIGRAHV